MSPAVGAFLITLVWLILGYAAKQPLNIFEIAVIHILASILVKP